MDSGQPPLLLTFDLQVFERFFSLAVDHFTVRANVASSTAPVADAGPDQSVGPATLVALDGSGSFVPDPKSGPLIFNLVQPAGRMSR